MTISLAYYIIENGLFEKLYRDRENNILKGKKGIKMPPRDIDNMLYKISNQYNCKYNEALSFRKLDCQKIPNPRELIKIFFSEFEKQNYPDDIKIDQVFRIK